MLGKNIFLFFFIIISTWSNSFAFDHSGFKQWPDTDFTKYSIRLEDVLSLGSGKDGIASIDNPVFKDSKYVTDIPLNEPVISVNIEGQVRAYPLRMLIWHEIVNDKIADIPIAITYSPLSSSAIVYDRRVGGVESRFGVTGQLYKSNTLMYDSTTYSWWQQYTGEAVVGKQIGKKLNIITSRIESLAMFKARYEDSKIMVSNTVMKIYGTNPYVNYDTYFPVLYNEQYSKKINPMQYLVVGNNAWPLHILIDKKLIKTGDMEGDIVLRWFPYQSSALDNAVIAKGRELGNVIAMQKQKDGSYENIPYKVTFAFIFDAFHKDGIVHSNK